MPEDKDTTCGGIPNSLLHQVKKNGDLLSSQLDYLREARGQDDSLSLLSTDKRMS